MNNDCPKMMNRCLAPAPAGATRLTITPDGVARINSDFDPRYASTLNDAARLELQVAAALADDGTFFVCADTPCGGWGAHCALSGQPITFTSDAEKEARR